MVCCAPLFLVGFPVRMLRPRCLLLSFLVFCALASAVEAPKLVQKDGRWALFVEGRPYLILGGQIHNSSSWPSELPQVWASLAALHANTVEAVAQISAIKIMRKHS